MFKSPFFHAVCTASLTLLCATTYAKVPQAEADKLGVSLTPVGADPKASADGAIPAWAGEKLFTASQKSIKPKTINSLTPAQETALYGGRDKEKPLFTINAQNYKQYAAKLTAGHQKLFDTYKTYTMNVYKSERPAFFPQAVYDATKKNAVTATLTGTDGIKDATLGFPFPIPTRAEEAIWNHRLKYRGTSARRFNNQAIVQQDGTVALTKLIEDVKFKYATLDAPGNVNDNLLIYYMAETMSPPRVAGQIILAHETVGPRAAWIYNPGLRRVRRAPNVAYDNPSEGTDGNQFNDQIDMFNGSMDRYKWKLVGKKEMYISYNAYAMNARQVKYSQILTKQHTNQALVRYEPHRVWVIESQNAGTGLPTHTFGRRTFYLDEDSWSIAAVDCYDKQGKFYKFQEGHLIVAPWVPTTTASPEVIYDLQTGRYFVTAMSNEDQVSDTEIRYEDKYFTQENIAKKATR